MPAGEWLTACYSLLHNDRLTAGIDRLLLHKDTPPLDTRINLNMIRKLKSGEYRLYSRKKNPSTGKKRNLGTFHTLEQAKQHEREVQYFKRH